MTLQEPQNFFRAFNQVLDQFGCGRAAGTQVHIRVGSLAGSKEGVVMELIADVIMVNNGFGFFSTEKSKLPDSGYTLRAQGHGLVSGS
jgi:hypothetical protein